MADALSRSSGIGIRRFSTAIAAVAAVSVLAAPAEASACSCAGLDASELLRITDAAVIARLNEVVPVAGTSKSDYVYELLEVFKGKRRLQPGEQLVVRAWAGEAGCGPPSTVNSRYGVFLERTDQRWTTNFCIVVSPLKMRKAASGRAAASSGSPCR